MKFSMRNFWTIRADVDLKCTLGHASILKKYLAIHFYLVSLKLTYFFDCLRSLDLNSRGKELPVIKMRSVI